MGTRLFSRLESIVAYIMTSRPASLLFEHDIMDGVDGKSRTQDVQAGNACP
jgi:hypothetical protein